MKFLDEYRDSRIAHALGKEIAQRTTRSWVLMEICGGQTHTIMRYGLAQDMFKTERGDLRGQPCMS